MTNRIRQSIFFSALERYGGFLLFAVATAVLSRLLNPQEFGIYSVVAALTAIIGAAFQEFGGANYLVQKSWLSEGETRTAFTITLCMSVLLAVAFFELRETAVWFYSTEELKVGIAVATLNFLLLPFIITISALLRRDMEFATLARCNLIGYLINVVISILLALWHFSFLAPIWGMIAGNVALLASLVWSRFDLSIFRPSFAGYKDVLNFGAYSSCVVIINSLYGFAPQLILGRIIDFTAVGLYSRASNVSQLFDRLIIQAASPVVMPAAMIHKRAGGDLKDMYLQAIEMITVLQWPFLTFVALMAHPIIWIWLGPTWMETVPIIQLLCIASLFLFAACLTYPFLVAVGRVRDTLVSSLISLPPSLILIFIASLYSVQAVAASALLTLPFQALVALYFVSRRLAIYPLDLIRATLKSGIVTVCSVAGALVSMAIIEYTPVQPIVRLILVATSAGAGWSLGLVMTCHPLMIQLRLAAGTVAGAAPTFGGFGWRDVGKRSL